MAKNKKKKPSIEGNNAIQGSTMDKVLKGRTEYQYWESKFRKLRNEQEKIDNLRKITVSAAQKGQS